MAGAARIIGDTYFGGVVAPTSYGEQDLGASNNYWGTVYALTLKGDISTSQITSGTLSVSRGGTGKSSFTANSVIMSGSNTTSALTTRAVTDSSSASAISTNNYIVTERDIYYGLPTINNSHSYTSSTTIYAPTAGGTANYVLMGNGTTTAPIWKTPKDALNIMINALDTGSSNLTSNDYVITQYVGGGTTTTTYHRRPASALRVGGLLTARKLKVALNSTTDVTFDGTADQTSIPVNGTLPIANGGTGATTAAGIRENLGLSNAMHFIGITTTTMSDGLTTANITVNNATHTPVAGDVVLYSDTEYVWTGSAWERLGRDSSFKTTQTAVTSATAETTTATTFVHSVTQDANGVITVKTRPLPQYNNYSLPLAASGTRGGIQIGFSTNATNRNYAVQLSSEKAYVNVPWTDTTQFTITANATDGYWDLTGTSGTNAVTYTLAPYSSKQSGASFYTGTTNPDGTTRLNYNGYFYGTKLYSNGAEVLTWKTHSGDTVNAIYDLGVYVNQGSATNTSITGNKYANILNIPYRKASGNTKADYAWSIGTSTSDDKRLFFRTSGADNFSAWQEIAHAPIGTSNIGSATQPVYMTATGVITAGTALKALAYKDSLTKSDVGLDKVENTTLSTWAGTANITTVGTISTGTWSGTAIAANKGGTGQTSYTIGDILYASSTSALSKLGGNTTTTRKFLRSAATTSGTAVAPVWDTVTATDVGLSNVTNTAALNKNTGAKGDIIYWSATDTPAHLTNTSSTTKNFLSITSQVPAWTTLSKSDVGLGNVENTALSTWTGSNKIATVGTITSGTWQGTKIGTSYLPTASTSAAGIVQLSSATNSTSTTLAATASAVKAAYDLANGKTSNTGTVTSITISATSPVSVSATGAITTSGTRTISLADAYGDTKNPYGTKTANYVLAGPSSGNAAAPAFRALVAADIPNLAAGKITSGTFDAARIPSLSTDKLTSGTLPVSRGGTGQTSIANIQAGKDGDGNTISSTYLKLSGGIMTGVITTHGLKGTLNIDYGDTLPSNPTEGQVFFQLSDPQYELPTGGTTGQALIKSSNNDRDVTWGSVTVNDRVAKAGDTMTGQLCSANTGGQWILGRDNALIRHTTAVNSSSFSPIFSSKTMLGSWEAGPCHPNEEFLFSYATDANYNSSTNVTQHNIRFTASGQVYGAVWNDYAEMRHTAEDIKPGSCVYEIGDDIMTLTTKRLQKGCKIVSDTFGFNIGETDTAKTPIAVAGRALVYLLEGREAAKNAIGEFVCSGPNGTVSIMTTEEYLQNPQAVVGTISSVPDYEEWGSGNVKVDGRIWIYVR